MAFPAKAPIASDIYRKRKRCAWSRRIFFFFCRSARLLELLQETRYRIGLLVLFFWHFWKFLLNALYKHAFFYMIGSWRVVLTYTIAFYTYQSTFLSKKLNVEEKLTAGPSPTVYSCNCVMWGHHTRKQVSTQCLYKWFLRSLTINSIV